ncbi:MAG TPA: hypothetical protein VFZ66_27425 [Herpetosiphonaceae bacterium]
MAEQVNKSSFTRFTAFLVVVLFAWSLEGCGSPDQGGYAVYVKSQATNDSIAAKVTMTIDGLPPDEKFTADDGYVRFPLRNVPSGTNATINVEADGFFSRTITIDVTTSGTFTIKLDPVSATIPDLTPTPEPSLSNIPSASPSSSPTSTETLLPSNTAAVPATATEVQATVQTTVLSTQPTSQPVFIPDGNAELHSFERDAELKEWREVQLIREGELSKEQALHGEYSVKFTPAVQVNQEETFYYHWDHPLIDVDNVVVRIFFSEAPGVEFTFFEICGEEPQKCVRVAPPRQGRWNTFTLPLEDLGLDKTTVKTLLIQGGLRANRDTTVNTMPIYIDAIEIFRQ